MKFLTGKYLLPLTVFINRFDGMSSRVTTGCKPGDQQSDKNMGRHTGLHTEVGDRDRPIELDAMKMKAFYEAVRSVGLQYGGEALG
jgi:hypothetical protein